MMTLHTQSFRPSTCIGCHRRKIPNAKYVTPSGEKRKRIFESNPYMKKASIENTHAPRISTRGNRFNA